MKKVLFVLVGLALMMSSCVTTYNVNRQKAVYETKMKGSPKDVALMEKIPIYYVEKDVPKEFTIVSYCAYQPLHIPIIRPARKALMKKLYKKAVTTANKMHGDAVIIDTDYEFRVIKWK